MVKIDHFDAQQQHTLANSGAFQLYNFCQMKTPPKLDENQPRRQKCGSNQLMSHHIRAKPPRVPFENSRLASKTPGQWANCLRKTDYQGQWLAEAGGSRCAEADSP